MTKQIVAMVKRVVAQEYHMTTAQMAIKRGTLYQATAKSVAMHILYTRFGLSAPQICAWFDCSASAVLQLLASLRGRMDAPTRGDEGLRARVGKLDGICAQEYDAMASTFQPGSVSLHPSSVTLHSTMENKANPRNKASLESCHNVFFPTIKIKGVA